MSDTGNGSIYANDGSRTAHLEAKDIWLYRNSPLGRKGGFWEVANAHFWSLTELKQCVFSRGSKQSLTKWRPTAVCKLFHPGLRVQWALLCEHMCHSSFHQPWSWAFFSRAVFFMTPVKNYIVNQHLCIHTPTSETRLWNTSYYAQCILLFSFIF